MLPKPVAVKLDDGTRGTLHVYARACAKDEDCSPYDCGCTGPPESESYWIEIRKSDGGIISRKHLWAAYGAFQIVPIDLIDGPGDELLIARIPAHASPPIGHDLQIWRMGSRPTQIGGLTTLGTSLNWPSCAWWQVLLTVDQLGLKPRAIAVSADLMAQTCCRVAGRALNQASALRRPHALQFDAKSGRYVLTGPDPRAFSRGDY